MSDKVAEYRKQQGLTATLLQGAKDELITKLVESITSLGKAIDDLKELAPEYKVSELSEWKKLATKIGLSDSKPAKSGKRGKRKSKAGKGKSSFTLSDDKASVILDFIGAGEKSTQEIADKLKTKNASNALTYLKKQKKIEVARKIGLKKIWKRV